MIKKFSLVTSIAFLIAISTTLASADPDLLDTYKNSSSKKPFVTFFARDDGLTGHAFVGIGVELDNGLLFYEGVYGYYPTSIGLSSVKALYKDQGVITFKFDDLVPSVTFRTTISESQKAKVLKVLDTWRAADPGYNLLAKGGANCSVLGREIAKEIGLKLPSEDPGLTLPASYIQSLKSVNLD